MPDRNQLADAVADADLRVLLMSVFHHSGDRRWLESPFTPRRDVSLVADERAGLPDDVADEIRAAAIDLAGTRPAIDDPGDGLMVEMMSVCLGEDIPPEYAPMFREEMGLVDRDVSWSAVTDLDVLVVGAGASGVAMAAALDRLGLPYRIVEKGPSVGGVWRENRYPGCGVDTPNHAYSFSFTPPHRWSRYFAPRAEVEAYLADTASNLDIVDHIDFDTEVVGARWDDDRHRWSVSVDGPDGRLTHDVAVLVSAIGQVNTPKTPDVVGVDEFAGRALHSAEWPDDLDLTGKHVAVVGTGASAMQLVPAVADEVASLTVYQRSPQWARPIPRYQDPIPAGSQFLFEHLPYYAAWFRLTMTWRYGDGLLPLLRKDPDWTHPDRSVNRTNDRHRQQMADHIETTLAGRPDLIDKCVPDYPPYGKRILLDSGWFDTLLHTNVELVTDAVDALDGTGVVAGGTHRPADVVVWATGFDITQMAARLGIVGRDGLDLADVWADDDPTAYLGITVPGFPNFFCLQGPNTGLGHGGSAIFQSECQVRHAMSCLAAIVEAGADEIEDARIRWSLEHPETRYPCRISRPRRRDPVDWPGPPEPHRCARR